RWSCPHRAGRRAPAGPRRAALRPGPRPRRGSRRRPWCARSAGASAHLAGDAAGDGGEDLVGDGPGGARPVLRGRGGGAVRIAARVAEEEHPVAGAGVGVRAEVDHDLVHADAAHLRGAVVAGLGADDEVHLVAAGTVEAVGVPDRHQAQPGAAIRAADAAVADAVPLTDLLDQGEAAGEGHRRTPVATGGQPYSAIPTRTRSRCRSGRVRVAAEFAMCCSGIGPTSSASAATAESNSSTCWSVAGSSGSSAVVRWVHAPATWMNS